MNSETLVVVADFLQSCVPFLFLLAYVPQWKMLIETKSSRDISLQSWIVWTVSALFSLFYSLVQYSINGHGIALVFSAVMALLFMTITMCLVFIYRRSSLHDGAKS